ncbi:hypothetical protein [Arcicella rosea]|uniref:Uncharacterized protein n=1 Tax=Arcicella rosea TaxID=502909 RepID=A0A841EPL0_9BACT|nr:hypothetical protein [Arcicella rosea]MBB6002210.1 hypothetical protein [Arcicella rosea]
MNILLADFLPFDETEYQDTLSKLEEYHNRENELVKCSIYNDDRMDIYLFNKYISRTFDLDKCKITGE